MTQTVIQKVLELEKIASVHKRRLKFNKHLLISAIVLGASSMVLSPLAVLIEPAALVLFILSFIGSVIRKPKEQRVALQQIALLKAATKEVLGAKGISAERVKALTDDFPWKCRDVPFDENLRNRFVALCHSKGIMSGGILGDDRLL
jgi:hypothetical protein